jgi:DNA-binding transcriptional MerR regulator
MVQTRLEPPRKTSVLSIGEFSKVTGLTVKTLRFYHEQGVLIPSQVDPDSGYRYYAPAKIESARIITRLRELDFPLAEIAELLSQYNDDGDILDHLENRKHIVEARLRKDQGINRVLDQIITQEREARKAMTEANYEVETKVVESQLIAGVRIEGKYRDCGRGFAQISRKFGRHICGKAFLLHYDTEYKADNADFEACMPIRKGSSMEGISVRELPGGRCVALLHKGPYEELGRSYAKILSHIKEQGYEILYPTREVYLKGPGMIFKGNPKKYLTEIQMLIKE